MLKNEAILSRGRRKGRIPWSLQSLKKLNAKVVDNPLTPCSPQAGGGEYTGFASAAGPPTCDLMPAAFILWVDGWPLAAEIRCTQNGDFRCLEGTFRHLLAPWSTIVLTWGVQGAPRKTPGCPDLDFFMFFVNFGDLLGFYFWDIFVYFRDFWD